MSSKKSSNIVIRLISLIYRGIKGKKSETDLPVTSQFFAPHKEIHPDPNSVLFPVVGAGIISISDNPHHMCGDTPGFGIGVSWGRYGYIGGVLGRTQALKLANMIIAACKDITETEEEEVARRRKEWETQNKLITS